MVRCRPITWLVAKLHEWQIKSLDNEVRGKEWNTCFYSTPSIKMPFTFLRRESDFEMVWDWEVKLLVKRFSWILIRRDFWGPGNGDWGLSWLGVNPHQINIFFLVGCIADILLQLAWPRPLIWVCVMDNSHYLDECALFPSFRLEYLRKWLRGYVWIFLFLWS